MVNSAALKKIIESYEKDNLMNILNQLQEEEGYLSESSLKMLSEKSKIPLASLYSTASFYSFFRLKKC